MRSCVLERKAIRVTAGAEVLKIRRETVAHPTRLYQTSDEPSGFPDARGRQGPRRAQPDGARQQYEAGDQPHRRTHTDPGGASLRDIAISAGAARIPPQDATPATAPPQTRTDRRPSFGRGDGSSPQPLRREIPHGLERFCGKNQLSQTSRAGRFEKASRIQFVPVAATGMSS